ncbi:MAG: FitA-like ribbon-helix-helix domain-containing protein [Spirochaetota bacterium]
MKNITVRGIDKETEESLKKASKQMGTSMNQAVIMFLKKALGLNKKHFTVYHDLDFLAGTWNEEEMEAFTKGTKPFEIIDKEMWNETSND